MLNHLEPGHSLPGGEFPYKCSVEFPKFDRPGFRVNGVDLSLTFILV